MEDAVSPLCTPDPRVGIVVIGRNEGDKLRKALESIVQGPVFPHETVGLYVDSGSTDGSVELAQTLNVCVHRLDAARPFSAARARNEGAAELRKEHPQLDFLQFLDGDCRLDRPWLQTAIDYASQHRDVGIVCGRLEEEAPERSLFNQVNSIHWSAERFGDIDSCGGVFLVRTSVFESVDGFNALLLTGEEAELCTRVRKQEHRVTRLDTCMAYHDSDLLHFGDWWKRAMWGGYGDGLEYRVLLDGVSPERRKETRSVLLCGLTGPVIIVLGAAGAIWLHWLVVLPVISLLGYSMLFARVMRFRRAFGESIREAALYSVFTILRKIPSGIGFLRCMLSPDSTRQRPDPHRNRR